MPFEISFADWIKFDIGFDEGYSILRYEVGQEYKPHADYAAHLPRYLSALILLNPSEYEGGEFQLMFGGDTHMHTMKPPIGTAIIFPATSRHRLRPLRSGKRTSLVAWMGGPPFR